MQLGVRIINTDYRMESIVNREELKVHSSLYFLVMLTRHSSATYKATSGNEERLRLHQSKLQHQKTTNACAQSLA